MVIGFDTTDDEIDVRRLDGKAVEAEDDATELPSSATSTPGKRSAN